MTRFLTAASLLGLLLACGEPSLTAPLPDDPATPVAEAPVTETGVVEISDAGVQLTDSGRTISWTQEIAGPVTVKVSTDPLDASDPIAILIPESEGVAMVLDMAERSNRVYYHITPANGETVTTALRLLPLEGGRNFRDLGGYDTIDGQTVKWGHAFRSGMMSGLTASDYQYLSSLGIQVVCDFRANSEREVEPTDWAAGEIDYLTWDYEDESANEDFAKVFMDPEVSPEKVRDLMIGFYHRIAYDHAEKYEVMFDRLAAGDIPLAFNCSAGKDRAGTGAALLLTALGVPRETVIADYALSDDYVDYAAEFAKSAQKGGAEDNPYAFLMQLPPEIVAPLLASDPAYIEATLDKLEEDHGSVMNFIQTELKVTDEELAAIRANLLQ